MDQLDLFMRLGLALAIGFLIGLERGWQEREEPEGSRTAGIRTFALIALAGAIVALISSRLGASVFAAGFAVTGAALAWFMWREGERKEDLSATTLVASLLTFALGAYAVLGDPSVAAAAAVAAAAILSVKQPLHGWLSRLTWPELKAGLLLAAMTFILLPLMPDRAVDPFDALNPRQLWLMTILIAAVSSVGYAAMKIAGPKLGLIATAATGGLVSSTATTLYLGRLARAQGGSARFMAGAILVSAVVMLLRVLFVAGVLNVGLARQIGPALGAAATAGGLAALALLRHGEAVSGEGVEDLKVENPFELREVLRFGLLLAAVMLAVEITRQSVGEAGLYGLAVLSGLVDVDAMTVSMARPASGMNVPASTAGLVVLLTCAVNSIVKVAYGAVAGGFQLGLYQTVGTAAMLVAGLLVLWSFAQ